MFHNKRWSFLCGLLVTLIQFGSLEPNVCGAADPDPSTAPEAADKPAANGVVSGRIVNDSGSPEHGAKVTLLRWEAPSQRFGHWTAVKNAGLSDKNGKYRFDKVADGYYLCDVKKSGFARAYCYRTIEKGQVNSHADIILNPPASAILQITDESGAPVEGAHVRAIRHAGKNGEVSLPQMTLRDLEITIPASNAAGQIELPPFPAGDNLKITVDHSRLAPVRLENVIIADGIVAKATMKPGVVLTLKRTATSDEDLISSAVLELHHDKFERPSTIIHHEVKFDRDGATQITIEPGNYNFLRLQHNDFYLTPTLNFEGKQNGSLHFELGRNTELTFQVHTRITAKGRVIDAETGLPVIGDSLLGEIVTPESTTATDRIHFNFTGWADTDENGEFTIPVAAGSNRVQFHGTNRISETEFIDFVVAPDGSTKIPDIKVRQLPKLVGTVRHADGSPAAKAVVRFRGKSIGGNHLADPVLTDENGRFQLQAGFVPKDSKTNQRQFEQYVVAFDPYQPLAAKIDVRLDKSDPIELTLEPHDFDWPLTELQEDMGEWQRGIVTPEQQADYAAISLRGRPALDFAAADWINSDSLNLTALRGKYVLLDFWFIGCGPCHADFPSVTMVHELYQDRGLVVIGVHNNSNPPDAVRKHVSELGLPFPVMVDKPDGSTVARYEKHGIARGYPSYVLIGPDGNVLLDDRTVPHPTLRSYKLEVIRNFLFGNVASNSARD